jgi:hypothetical protein
MIPAEDPAAALNIPQALPRRDGQARRSGNRPVGGTGIGDPRVQRHQPK